MGTFLLKKAGDNPLADAIRAAVGASDGEDVEVTTPTFHRPSAWTPAMIAPDDIRTWKGFATLTAKQLHAWGCRRWSSFSIEPPRAPDRATHRDAWFFDCADENDDGRVATHELWLFPAEWYGEIPDGLPITDINGCIEPFAKGSTDDGRRFGMLAYGVMVALRSSDRT